MGHSSAESSLVFEMKEKQDRDPSLVMLKQSVRYKNGEVFSQGVDDVFHCQGRFCVPGIDDLRQ